MEIQAEKYMNEMMRLYGRSTSRGEVPQKAPPVDETVQPMPEEPVQSEPEAQDDTAWAPHPENDAEDAGIAEDYNSRYPDPDLSDLNTDDGTVDDNDSQPPEYVSEESLVDSKGYILVNVRAGDESSAIEGATVSVTATVDGKRMLIASGLTNISGTTEKFEVPVPAPGLSQYPSPDKRPYNLFDVSVTAKGYFNARSVDVPVFSGITSVQNFNMIPVPVFMSGSDETVTYFNQEPDFDITDKEGG